MAKQATSRLKLNPILGRLPVLQFLSPSELNVDGGYQRSVLNTQSQKLIRKIAQHWNWDLCLPLVVSRRRIDGKDQYFVIDGQHRWQAAVLRKDIHQLPCVIVEYADAAEEAASFVNLNQERKALSKVDLFKAALASEDEEAIAIFDAMEQAGLTLSPHSNPASWKPGMVANIGGIIRAWCSAGPKPTSAAMSVLAKAYPDEVLRYAGTIFHGILAVCINASLNEAPLEGVRLQRVVNLVSAKSQVQWRSLITVMRASDPKLNYSRASAKLMQQEWDKSFQFTKLASLQKMLPDMDGRVWCDQCDFKVAVKDISGCRSKFCTVRGRV